MFSCLFTFLYTHTVVKNGACTVQQVCYQSHTGIVHKRNQTSSLMSTFIPPGLFNPDWLYMPSSLALRYTIERFSLSVYILPTEWSTLQHLPSWIPKSRSTIPSIHCSLPMPIWWSLYHSVKDHNQGALAEWSRDNEILNTFGMECICSIATTDTTVTVAQVKLSPYTLQIWMSVYQMLS